MSRFAQIGFVVAILLVMAASVQAATYTPMFTATNGGGTTVLFQDDFETGTVGSEPVATTGTWHIDHSAGSPDALVANAASAGWAAAAGNGSKFLESFRPAGGQPCYAYGNSAVATAAGDTIALNFAFRVDGTLDDGGEHGAPGLQSIVELYEGGTQGYEIGFTNTGAIYDLGPTSSGGSAVLLTQGYNHAAWNTLSLTTVNGSGTLQLSVNGQTPETALAFAGNEGVNLNKFDYGGMWSQGAGGTSMCIDGIGLTPAVPEPSSIALLSAGLLTLLAYAWKKRT
jgi:hypothetical protein